MVAALLPTYIVRELYKMAKFCTKCGAQLDDAAQFCSSCGTAQTAQQTPPQQENTQQTNQSTQQQTYTYTPPKGDNIFNEAMKQEDFTAQYHPQDIKDNKVMAVLSYLGFLTLIPFFAEKNSHYVRFHCVQGMYLFLCELAVGVVSGIVTNVLDYIPYVGWIIDIPVSILFSVAGLALFVIQILGIVNAASGKAKNLPVIYMIRDRLGWFK